MPFATIIGSVGSKENPIRDASVTSSSIIVSCLDGAFMTIVHCPGVYEFTAVSEKYRPQIVRVKVTPAAIRKGEAIEVTIPLREAAPRGKQATLKANVALARTR